MQGIVRNRLNLANGTVLLYVVLQFLLLTTKLSCFLNVIMYNSLQLKGAFER